MPSLKVDGRVWRFALLLGLALPLALYTALAASRPAARSLPEHEIFDGIAYSQERIGRRSPVMTHFLKIDLSAEGIRPAITTPCDDVAKAFCAKTTAVFLKETRVQVAVNASYFYPFRERTFWHFRPRAGEHAFPLGVVIAEGERLAPPRAEYPSLCFGRDRASIQIDGACPEETLNAIAGRVVIEPGDKLDEQGFAGKAYPLTLAGLDNSGTTLFILIVDGKQPFYSDGLKLRDGAEILIRRGAAKVLQLDGGGSTTLVIEGTNGARTLNSPIHTKIPGRQRPVATHLGFFALPAEN